MNQPTLKPAHLVGQRILLSLVLAAIGLSLPGCEQGGTSISESAKEDPTSIASQGGTSISESAKEDPTSIASHGGAKGRLLFTPLHAESPLEWAQMLVRNVKPADTGYQNKIGSLTWAGEEGAQSYTGYADCSSFIAGILTQAYGITREDYQQWLNTPRPLAKTFYDAIISEGGLIHIERLMDARPGDLIAIRYVRSSPGDNTGHIIMISGVITRRPSSKPDVADTMQWDVPVIDASESGHGRTDTRSKADGSFYDGVGEGLLRLYTDPDGKVIGYTWSDSPISEYYDRSVRPIAIGRLDLQFKVSNQK